VSAPRPTVLAASIVVAGGTAANMSDGVRQYSARVPLCGSPSEVYPKTLSPGLNRLPCAGHVTAQDVRPRLDGETAAREDFAVNGVQRGCHDFDQDHGRLPREWGRQLWLWA
jgi:hypothetical protein